LIKTDVVGFAADGDDDDDDNNSLQLFLLLLLSTGEFLISISPNVNRF